MPSLLPPPLAVLTPLLLIHISSQVNVLNDALGDVNASDPVSGYQGIPRNMTALASKLAAVGYRTIHAGKWHVGLATPDHTPQGRGFGETLGYLDGANDYWTYIGGTGGGYCADNSVPFTDLWGTNGPAYGKNNSWACSQGHQAADCVYEDALFTNFTVNAIANHDTTVPLFLYLAFHNVHAPLEVPAADLARFAFIDDPDRRAYAAMVNVMDTHLGSVVTALRDRGMWDDTLMVVSADNGGPIYYNGTAGANNWPLRGGKMSNLEGGIRVNAFVAGGLLPPSRRGVVEAGVIAMQDWYATFCGALMGCALIAGCLMRQLVM